MSNPMRYIKQLEAVGFQRNQAEAQVQMVLDAIEGDLATKNDITILKSELSIQQERSENRLHQFEERIENRLHQFEERIERRFLETEFRLITRLGLLTVSSTSIGVAVLTWLIKI